MTGSTSHRSLATVLNKGHLCSTAVSGSQGRRAFGEVYREWPREEQARLRSGLPLLTQEFATAQLSFLCEAGSPEGNRVHDALGLTSSRSPL